MGYETAQCTSSIAAAFRLMSEGTAHLDSAGSGCLSWTQLARAAAPLCMADLLLCLDALGQLAKVPEA